MRNILLINKVFDDEKSFKIIAWIRDILRLVWFVGFYGISTFVGYLTPNPFLCK